MSDIKYYAEGFDESTKTWNTLSVRDNEGKLLPCNTRAEAKAIVECYNDSNGDSYFLKIRICRMETTITVVEQI